MSNAQARPIGGGTPRPYGWSHQSMDGKFVCLDSPVARLPGVWYNAVHFDGEQLSDPIVGNYRAYYDRGGRKYAISSYEILAANGFCILRFDLTFCPERGSG